MKIRAALPEDIPAMIALDLCSDTSAHWANGHYQDLFTTGRLVLIAVEDKSASSEALSELDENRLGGWLVARSIDGQWELENIVVSPSLLRNGIGKALLQALFDAARAQDSESVFLEVRDSNGAARALYESAGFEITGRRKSYYSLPLEDAILYRFKVR